MSLFEIFRFKFDTFSFKISYNLFITLFLATTIDTSSKIDMSRAHTLFNTHNLSTKFLSIFSIYIILSICL